uniref:BF3164 family lipoprotein n=1 Tax=Roseivirga sp. TaxID=1964215 RepID=UPI004048E12C
MRVSVYIFYLILVFSGCAQKDGSTLDDGSQLIDISSIRSTDILISPRNLMTDVEYIKLKSPEAFFLTEAQKILELDGKILILDKHKKVLVAYDLQGNFLGQVGQKGLGPEEYKSATDFAVDLSSRSIFIFSRGEQSILEFNSDLSFQRKLSINIWAFQMSVLKNQNLAFYAYFEEGNSNITILNQKGEVIDSRMAFPEGENYEVMDYTGFFCRSILFLSFVFKNIRSRN